MVIVDMFDDFVIGVDKSEVVFFVGLFNMVSLYDQVIDYLNKGVVIDGISEDLDVVFLGMLVWVYYFKVLWVKMNLLDVGNLLINDFEVIKFVQEVLDKMGVDYKFVLDMDLIMLDVVGILDIGQ